MPLITLETTINAPIEICFDLSRSIDLHTISTAKTNESVIDGITKGLINYNEFVTWQAKHFGIRQKLTSKITAYNKPFHFCDEQIKGPFKKIKHDHYFVEKDNMILMTDDFLFESPFGILGRIFNKLVLTAYLKKFLIERNQIIKEYAETGKWKELLVY
jgi:ligand-binding SRPBCC domain-containing protein